MIKRVDRDELLGAVKPLLQPAAVVLDIGCGIRPADIMIFEPRIHVCVDPHGEYLQALQPKPGQLLFHGDWEDALMRLDNFDAIYLLDVIEHLERDEAAFLLRASLKRVRKQVVIFTPLGFLPQEPKEDKDAWGMNGGDWQKHRSGWEPKDFEDPGWEVIAANGFHDNHGAFWAVYTKE